MIIHPDTAQVFKIRNSKFSHCQKIKQYFLIFLKSVLAIIESLLHQCFMIAKKDYPLKIILSTWEKHKIPIFYKKVNAYISNNTVKMLRELLHRVHIG